ncbi:MAG: molybdopterin molybdotransferase MoeA [Trueperaceae bacterium]
MIEVGQADRILAENVALLPTYDCQLENAHGKVLREDIRADRDQPPYHRVTMDGIAISTAAFDRGVRAFHRQGVQAAGRPPLRLTSPDGFIEVMTGGVLPEGCDAVIRIEDVELRDATAFLEYDVSPTPMQYVHLRGSDGVAGDVVLRKGVRLSPAHVAIAASIGSSFLRVSSSPAVAVVSTGDELVELASEVEEYQVRRSNVYAISAALSAGGYGEPNLCHVGDDRAALSSVLADLLDRCDLLVLTGGVSMGKFDFVSEVLAELGVENHIHRVRQRPGKPLWFGARGEKAVFALPGNPVSALVCLYRYVLPYVERASGAPYRSPRRVRLSREAKTLPEFTRFLPVTLDSRAGELTASPVEINTSGDFLSLGGSDGFVELAPASQRVLKTQSNRSDGVLALTSQGAAAGAEVPFYSWRVT